MEVSGPGCVVQRIADKSAARLRATGGGRGGGSAEDHVSDLTPTAHELLKPSACKNMYDPPFWLGFGTTCATNSQGSYDCLFVSGELIGRGSNTLMWTL